MRLKYVLLTILVLIALIYFTLRTVYSQEKEKQAPERPKVVTKTTDDKGVTEYRVDDAVLKAIREKARGEPEKRPHEMSLDEYNQWLAGLNKEFDEDMRALKPNPRKYVRELTGIVRIARADGFDAQTVVGLLLDIPGDAANDKDREVIPLLTFDHKLEDLLIRLCKIDEHQAQISISGYVVKNSGIVREFLVVEKLASIKFVRR